MSAGSETGDADHGDEAVLWLGAKGSCAALKRLVAAQSRLIEIETEGEARALEDVLAAQGLERASLVAAGDHAAAAVRLALERPDRIVAIVLLAPTLFVPSGAPSPSGAAFAEKLGAIEVPMLALFGANDAAAPPEAGRHYRQRNSRCHLVFIYDATAAMGEERPEAVAELVSDFIRRGDRFIVRQQDDQLYR